MPASKKALRQGRTRNKNRKQFTSLEMASSPPFAEREKDQKREQIEKKKNVICVRRRKKDVGQKPREAIKGGSGLRLISKPIGAAWTFDYSGMSTQTGER